MTHLEETRPKQPTPAQCPDPVAWANKTRDWTLDEIATALLTYSYLEHPPLPDQHPPMPPWVVTWVIDSVIRLPHARQHHSASLTFRIQFLNAIPTLASWFDPKELAARIAELALILTPAAAAIACTLVESKALWASASEDLHAAISALISSVASHFDEPYVAIDTLATLWRMIDESWPPALQQQLADIGTRINCMDFADGRNRTTMLNGILINYERMPDRIPARALQPWLPSMRDLLRSQNISPSALAGLVRMDAEATWSDPDLRSCVLAHVGGASPVGFYARCSPFDLLEAVIASWPPAGVRAFAQRLTETSSWKDSSLRREVSSLLVSYEQAHLATVSDAQALCESPIAELRQMGFLALGALPETVSSWSCPALGDSP